MTREDPQDPQDLALQALLDHVRADPYPSREQLEMIERSLTPQMAREYLDTLLEKATRDRFPSNELLLRLEALAKSYPGKRSDRVEPS